MLSRDVAAIDKGVVDLARRFLDVALAEKATRLMLTWSLSDKCSWLNRPGPKCPCGDHLPRRSLPLDADFNCKSMSDAIAKRCAGTVKGFHA
jgi:GH35 family endo-1,4-beta-xylanase